jgi:hypothetical protein
MTGFPLSHFAADILSPTKKGFSLQFSLKICEYGEYRKIDGQ